LPQTRPRERAPQQHGDELADGRPRPLGLVDTAIRGAQRIGRPLGRIVGIVGGPAAGRLAGVDFNQVAMVVSGKLTVAFGLIT
jgi:hypothetical protein